MSFCEVGESWEECCQRKVLETRDSLRLYRGMITVIPLLRALPEVGDIDSVLSEMAICNHADARKVLIRWLRENCGTDGVASVLIAFDTYSV